MFFCFRSGLRVRSVHTKTPSSNFRHSRNGELDIPPWIGSICVRISEQPTERLSTKTRIQNEPQCCRGRAPPLSWGSNIIRNITKWSIAGPCSRAQVWKMHLGVLLISERHPLQRQYQQVSIILSIRSHPRSHWVLWLPPKAASVLVVLSMTATQPFHDKRIWRGISQSIMGRSSGAISLSVHGREQDATRESKSTWKKHILKFTMVYTALKHKGSIVTVLSCVVALVVPSQFGTPSVPSECESSASSVQHYSIPW
jgi:hypothetical protein